VPFQLVTIGYLALGNLIPLFAEKLVGDGCIALPMQHSKVDLSLYGDWNRPNRIVDKANADAAGPVWMTGDGFFG
jgi:hypothetical protein